MKLRDADIAEERFNDERLLINQLCLIFSGCTFPCTLKMEATGRCEEIFQKL